MTILSAFSFFILSVRWSFLDRSPPAWDQGLYVYQATILHHAFMQNGSVDFISTIFNVDRGRVPLLPVMAQPAFYLFGPSSDSAVISLNFAWFILAWAIPGITREMVRPEAGDKAGFFAFMLFGLYPITTLPSSHLNCFSNIFFVVVIQNKKKKMVDSFWDINWLRASDKSNFPSIRAASRSYFDLSAYM